MVLTEHDHQHFEERGPGGLGLVVQQTGHLAQHAQVCRLHREVEYVSDAQTGATREEWSYALTGVPPAQADAARLEQLWRGHWQSENGVHYVRDVTLGEDACQVRADRAPASLAACRNAALNLLRQHAVTTVAAALRRQAMYPRHALALMGIDLE